MSLTLIRKTVLSGAAQSCFDAGDFDKSDSLSAVLLGLRSVCLAPIMHPSGLRIGVLYADDRNQVGRYDATHAEWLAQKGAELGQKLSSIPRMMVIEPKKEIKLPELPANKSFTKLLTGLEKTADIPKVEELKPAAVQQLEDSIEAFRPKGGVRLARLLNELADIRQQDGDLDRAELLLRECSETMKTAGQEGTLEAVSFLNNLAGVLYRKGQTASAQNTYVQALSLLDEKNRNHWSRATPLLCNLGTLYAESGQVEEARFFIARAASLAKKSWGEDDPRTKRCVAKLKQLGALELQGAA